jgi:hypothetical protein
MEGITVKYTDNKGVSKILPPFLALSLYQRVRKVMQRGAKKIKYREW